MSNSIAAEIFRQHVLGARKADEFCEGCCGFDVDEFVFRLDSTHSNVKPSPYRIGKFYDIKKNKNCPLCRLVSSILDVHLDAHRRVKTPPPENLASAFVWLEAVSMPALRLTLKWELEDLEIHFPDTFEILEVSEHFNKRFVDVKLVKSWISSCTDEHKTCGSNIYKSNSAEFFFIDVNDCTLVQPQQLPRFVALSYVWGGVTPKGIEHASSFNLQDLPKTLRDAIIFTRNLGERYLWIDSLCISQEEAKKQKQISHMNTIYRQAVCVLVAAWGSNANAGLPASHDQSPRVISARSQKLERLGPGKETMYSISPLDLDDIYLGMMSLVKNQKWLYRAWCVQERLLAQRVIVFNGRDVFFFCHECRGYEMRRSLEAWSKPSFDFCLDRVRDDETDPEVSKWQRYQQVVRAVADTRITREDDRLNATLGLLQHLTTQMDVTFEMGLPLSYIDYALMWDCKKVHSTKYFPSWTWLGKVPIYFMFKRDFRAVERLDVDTKIEVMGNRLLRITALAVQTPAKKLWRCSRFERGDNVASYDSLGPEPLANIHPDGYTWTTDRKTLQLRSLYCLLIVGQVSYVTTKYQTKAEHVYFIYLLVVEETKDGRFKRIGIAEMPRKDFESMEPKRKEFVLK